MDHKKLLMYGGGTVAAYIGYRVIVARTAAAQAAADAAANPGTTDNSALLGSSMPIDTGGYVDSGYGSTDTSGGASATGTTTSTADASNMLTADQMMQIYAGNNANALALNQQNVTAATNMNDTNALSLTALVNSMMPGGSVSVSHSADGTTSISSTASQGSDALTQAYEQYLGRAPDSSGYSYYSGEVSSGSMTIPQAISSIQSSPEATVDNLYQQDLGRTADPGGLAYYTQQITTGAMTASQVGAALSGSSEAQAKKAA